MLRTLCVVTPHNPMRLPETCDPGVHPNFTSTIATRMAQRDNTSWVTTQEQCFKTAFFSVFFFCCILSIYFKLPIIFEVIEKNGDEARKFNKLIFVSD